MTSLIANIFCAVQDTLIAKEEIIGLNEANKPCSTNDDLTNSLHKTCDGNKVEDILEGTSTYNKAFQQSIFTERKNALIDIPLEKSFEMENKKIIKYCEKNKKIESSSIFILKQDDALEKNTIETLDFVNEENFLEIKKFKNRDCSSHVSENEDYCCLKPKESNNVVVNQSLVFTKINTDLEKSIDIMEKFESKDLVPNIDDRENSCPFRLKNLNEDMENQHIESKTTNINPQTSKDAIQSSMISKHPSSNIIVNSSPKEVLLDEFGRTMRNGGGSRSDNEDMHFIDENKSTSKKCLKNNEKSFFNQNCGLRSPNFSPSLHPYNKQKQRLVLIFFNI